MTEEKDSVSVQIDEEFLQTRGEEMFKNAKSGRELYEERLVKDLNLYHGRFSDDERKYSEFLGAPRLFNNKTYTGAQRILVDAIEAFYPDPEELCSIASSKDVPFETKMIVQALMNHRLAGHPISFYHEVYEMALDAIRNIVGVFKVYPRLKTQTVPLTIELTDPMTGEIVEVEHPTETQEQIIAWEPVLESVRPEDVYFSKWATWKDYRRQGVCHVYEKTVGELLALGFQNVLDSAEITDRSNTDQVQDARERDLRHVNYAEPSLSVKANQKRLVFEFWDVLPDEGGEMRSGSWFAVGDKAGPKKIARAWEWNELPYKFSEFEPVYHPFIVGCAFPEPHQMYGKSFPWITESMQKEINAITNQEREAVARALRPQTYVNRDGGVDLVALMNKRIGSTVQGDGPADSNIKEMTTMNPMAISPAHRARVDQDYAEAGVPQNMFGGESVADTATESTQQLANANKKIALILKNLAYTAVIPSFQYLLRLIQCYESDEFIKAVTGKVLGWGWGEDGLPAKEYIQGDFDLRVNLGLNKQAQASKLFLLIDRGNAINQANVQMVQMGVADPSTIFFVNTGKAYEDAMKVIGFKDIEQYRIPAIAPPMPQVEGPGMASQPTQTLEAEQAISQTDPQAPAPALGVL